MEDKNINRPAKSEEIMSKSIRDRMGWFLWEGFFRVIFVARIIVNVAMA